MIFGDLTKQELKIAKDFEKKLKKRDYKDVVIKQDTITKGFYTVEGIEPLGRRVISVKMNITEMKNRLS